MSRDRHGGPEDHLMSSRRRYHGYDSIVAPGSSTDLSIHRQSYSSLPFRADPGRHGWFNYCAYYVPILSWLPKYTWTALPGDIIAAFTVASLYIPLSFSFSIIAEVNPISGLYAFVFHPMIYAILGSCPQMIVGPEATGSLLVGAAVRQVQASIGDHDLDLNHQIAGVTTAIAGAILFAAGLGRVGFVDGVLNRPFLQGFISGVGFTLLVQQAIPELGLGDQARSAGVQHSSAVAKLVFLLKHLQYTHALTALVAFPSLACILVFRFIRKSLQPRYPSAALIPDRLAIVTITTIMTWKMRLDQRGLNILGSLGTSGSKAPRFYWPLSNFDDIQEIASFSFMAALLGFFESSISAKSVRLEKPGPKNPPISANREMIALGTANLLGGCFSTLPAFGGFGRSKLNVQTGGTTPMSSIVLSLVCLLCIYLILPSLYYVPRPVLSAMASVVGISMIEECPHDIRFFYRVKGWRELSLMGIVFLGTICHSMELGAALGIVLTLFSLVRHSTRSRIQILGRVPNTKHDFEDAELAPGADQFDQCLIIRIPEPLTFANSGDLLTRLRRLEWYGTHLAHPSQPRTRDEDRCLIFDLQGLTDIDACALQILTEIVEDRVRDNVQVVFCCLRPTGLYTRFERSGIVDACGGSEHFVDQVQDALRLADVSH